MLLRLLRLSLLGMRGLLLWWRRLLRRMLCVWLRGWLRCCRGHMLLVLRLLNRHHWRSNGSWASCLLA